MRLLYPCNPLDKSKSDESFRDEFVAAQQAGIPCALYSAEDFDLIGSFKPRPSLADGEEVLYRGWMLTPAAYNKLYAAVQKSGARMITTPEQYQRCHYLPEWYHLCEDVTPKTIFLERNANFANELSMIDWQCYFVKDYVKSLTTSRGSIARNAGEVGDIVGSIEKYRGQVEGGVCIREFESLQHNTEERYFIIRGRVHARGGDVPSIVMDIAQRIDSPFFSVDIVRNTEGALRLIELGDGQVSDRKLWSPEQLVRIFT